MNRINKYKHYHEQCSEIKLIDILDLQDKKINLLTQRVEHLIDLVQSQSKSLYELAKQPTEIFELTPFYELPKDEFDKAIAFDEMFKESLDELEKIINLDAPKHNIPRAFWYEDTDKRKPDEETIYVRPDGTEYIWLDDMWVRI